MRFFTHSGTITRIPLAISKECVVLSDRSFCSLWDSIWFTFLLQEMTCYYLFPEVATFLFLHTGAMGPGSNSYTKVPLNTPLLNGPLRSPRIWPQWWRLGLKVEVKTWATTKLAPMFLRFWMLISTYTLTFAFCFRSSLWGLISIGNHIGPACMELF